MNRFGVKSLLATCATLVSFALVSQAVFADDEEGKKRPSREEMRAKMLEKFDADGDGELNEAERKTLREEMAGRRKRGEGPARGDRPSREEIIKKFDKDGDGKLSDEERSAAREAYMKRAGGQRPQIDREAIMKKFDKDGDGKLSEEERTALREEMKKRFGDRRPGQKPGVRKPGGEGRPNREQILDKFDTDGDGELSETERKAARAAFEKRRGEAGERPGRRKSRPEGRKPAGE